MNEYEGKALPAQAVKAIRESRSIALLIHDLSAKFKCQLHTSAALTPGKNRRILWTEGWMGPTAGLGIWNKKKYRYRGSFPGLPYS